MSGNFAIKGGGVGPLMANAILNFHFDYLTTSLNVNVFGNSLDIDPVDELGTERPQDLTHSCHGTFLQLRISLWHLKAFKC